VRACGAIVAQDIGALAVHRRHVPVDHDLHAERFLGDQAVESAAMQGGPL